MNWSAWPPLSIGTGVAERVGTIDQNRTSTINTNSGERKLGSSIRRAYHRDLAIGHKEALAALGPMRPASENKFKSPTSAGIQTENRGGSRQPAERLAAHRGSEHGKLFSKQNLQQSHRKDRTSAWHTVTHAGAVLSADIFSADLFPAACPRSMLLMAAIWRSQAGVVTDKLFLRIKPHISKLGLPATRKVKKPDHLGAKRVAGSRHTLATRAHELDFLKPQSRNTQNPTNLAEDERDLSITHKLDWPADRAAGTDLQHFFCTKKQLENVCENGLVERASTTMLGTGSNVISSTGEAMSTATTAVQLFG